MNTALWILLSVAVAVVLGYLVMMRGLFRQSREDAKRIDYRNIRKWKDDDDS